jgi:hypothetical protein
MNVLRALPVICLLFTCQFCFSQSQFEEAPVANLIKVDSSDVRFLLSFYGDLLDSLRSACEGRICAIEVAKRERTKRYLRIAVVDEDFEKVQMINYGGHSIIERKEYDLHPWNALNIKNQWELVIPNIYETFHSSPGWPKDYKVYLLLLPGGEVLQVYTGSINLDDLPTIAALDMGPGLALFKFFFSKS